MALMTQVGLEFIARNRANRQISSFNRSIQRMGRQMLAMAGVGGGLYAVQRGFRSIIKAASDAEETQAKFNTVFKSLKYEANAWAKSFGESVGRSEQSVKSWMAGLQDTFVPLGIARDNAMELSKSLVSLAVDVASFNNAADADVIRDFTSALVGNHETVRKFGIIISETAIKQEAMRKGLNKTYKELTDLEKVQLRYSLIQRGSTDAQGDALRTADSYANQLKRLKANISDLSAEIGGPLMQSLSNLISVINENKSAWNDFFRTQTEGWEMVLSGARCYWEALEARGHVPKGGSIYGQFGGGVPGMGNIPLTPPIVSKPQISPKQYQHIAEMRARARELAERPTKPWVIPGAATAERRTELENQQKSAMEIGKKYLPALQREIEITGRIGEAHYHAAKMVDFENAIKKAGIENTTFATIVTEKYMQKLKELEGAQRLARIADDIGSSFASAFEDMIFEARKFEDVFKSLMQEIAMAVVRHAVIQPIAMGISGAMGEMFGEAGAVTPQAGAMFAKYQHGGLITRPTLALMGEAGPELVTPLNKLGQGGGGNHQSVHISIHNEGLPLKLSGTPVFDGKQWVISVVQENYADHGPMYDLINQGGP